MRFKVEFIHLDNGLQRFVVAINGWQTVKFCADKMNISVEAYTEILKKHNAIMLIDNIAMGFEDYEDAKNAINDLKFFAILSGKQVEVEKNETIY